MRDFLLPMVLIAVVVAGVWMYFEATAPHAGPVLTAPISTDTAPPPAPKVAPHPKRAIVQRPPEVTEPPAPVQVVKKPAPPPPPPRPIPTGTPEQVNVGMDASKVVELLGLPDLTALKVRRGNLSETYVYKERPGQNLALIRLEDGHVVTPQ
jgi:outer membrane biosynthesis protein TonB